MKEVKTGWVIINEKHPAGTPPFMDCPSFRRSKQKCINDFIYETGETWEYWSRKYKFQCVRATQTIQTS